MSNKAYNLTAFSKEPIKQSKRANIQMHHRLNSKEHLYKIQEFLQKCESTCNEGAAMRYALKETARRIK